MLNDFTCNVSRTSVHDEVNRNVTHTGTGSEWLKLS